MELTQYEEAYQGMGVDGLDDIGISVGIADTANLCGHGQGRSN